MDAHRTWLATSSGWLPGDPGPEWTGFIEMAGLDWQVGATRTSGGPMAVRMVAEVPRTRRKLVVEGSVPPAGVSRWTGLLDVGRTGRLEVSLRRAMPPGLVDLPDDRAALARFALISFALRPASPAAEAPSAAETDGRDFLSALDGSE